MLKKNKDDSLTWFKIGEDYLICGRKADSLSGAMKRMKNGGFYEIIGLVPLKKYQDF